MPDVVGGMSLLVGGESRAARPVPAVGRVTAILTVSDVSMCRRERQHVDSAGRRVDVAATMTGVDLSTSPETRDVGLHDGRRN